MGLCSCDCYSYLSYALACGQSLCFVYLLQQSSRDKFSDYIMIKTMSSITFIVNQNLIFKLPKTVSLLDTILTICNLSISIFLSYFLVKLLNVVEFSRNYIVLIIYTVELTF